MHKFDSSEGAALNKSAFNDGLLARIQGVRRDQCPKAEVIGAVAHESWLAGWDDANMDFITNPQQWDSLHPPAAQ